MATVYGTRSLRQLVPSHQTLNFVEPCSILFSVVMLGGIPPTIFSRRDLPSTVLVCNDTCKIHFTIKDPFHLLLLQEVSDLNLVPAIHGFPKLTFPCAKVRTVVTSDNLIALRLMKRRNPFRKESVSRESAISMCTARTVRQVNKHPYRFT